MDETRSCAEVLLEKRRALPPEPTNVRDLVRATKLSQRAFAERLNIPRRTVEDWCRGINKCPEYLINLLEYYLRHEGLIVEEVKK